MGILTQKIKFATIGLLLGLFSGAIGGSGGTIAIKGYFVVIAWFVTKIVLWTLSIGFTESTASLLGTALGGAFFGVAISLIHLVTKIALTPNEGFKSTIKQATMWIIIYTSIGIIAGLFAKPTFCGNVTDICG